MLNKKLIVTSYLVLALSLTACNSDKNVEEKPVAPPIEDNSNVDNDTTTIKDTTDTNISRPSSKDNLVKYEEIKLTATEAYNIFLEKKPGAKVEKVELDYDNNVYYYKIEGSDSKDYYEMKIDAVTGDIAKDEKDTKSDEDAEVSLDYVKKVDEYLKKAIEDSGEGFISLEWDLEVENGRPELEIEIDRETNEIEYTYDLETGELLEKDL